MGYSEPALILGHSPSPNLMPPLSSPQDIIPDIILGPFLFPVPISQAPSNQLLCCL